MKKILYILLFSVLPALTYSQDLLYEGFEAYDTNQLPSGWTRVNLGPTPPVSDWIHWIIRDTTRYIPGIENGKGKAHTGIKSIGVSWHTGLDTSGAYLIADSWLISKRVFIPAGGGYELSFWASGGSANYSDSLKFLISTTDSLPASFVQEQVIYWPEGSVHGQFQEFGYDLTPYSGSWIWLAWRYHQDVAQDGFYVFVDDVRIYNPFGIEPIGTNIPTKFDLKQNYPNPFNPVTNIIFDLPRSGHVKLTIYNSVGELITVLVDEVKNAGSYKVDFNATGLPSGAYFYKFESGDYVVSKKMVLTK